MAPAQRYPATSESELRDLYDLACRGAESQLVACADISSMMRTRDNRNSFYRAAHRGFHRAQEQILDMMSAPGPHEHEALWRMVMDSIAWQILGGQLYLARRLYRGHTQPSLLQSNLPSVRQALSHFTSHDFLTFALASDATSFIQLGDLLVADPNNSLTIVEVKEGETNARIMDFMQRQSEHPCAHAIHFFKEQEGPKTSQQLDRMVRQGLRLDHVIEIMNLGESVDPDNSQTVVIPEKTIYEDCYDDRLSSLLESVETKNWAIDVLDDCLFLGAYKNAMLSDAANIFKTWFHHSSGSTQFPVCDITNATVNPLALPILSRQITREQKFDLLYGRTALILGLDMNKFIELLQTQDLPIRWATKNETNKLTHGVAKTDRPWTCAGRAVVVDGPGALMPISDGILLRLFFHGSSPQMLADIVRSSLQLQAHVVNKHSQ